MSFQLLGMLLSQQPTSPINLRQSIDPLVCFLAFVPKDVSEAVHELDVRSRANKHLSSGIRNTIALMFQADLLQ